MKISVKTRWMILAPSQQASFVNDEEKISVIYWRLPGRFCTKSSLSMRWCGKQEAKRPCQRTTPHHRTSFEWFAVAVNDDELVMWRFFPKLLNLKETLQKILQPFFAFPIEVELRTKSFHFFGILKFWLFMLLFNLTASVSFDGLEGELFFCVKFKYEL